LSAGGAACDGRRAAGSRRCGCAVAQPTTKGFFRVIYELRVYHCLPNRLPALLKRFENHTLRIWEKHGIRQAGFWTTTIGESNHDLTYLLAWESLAEREQKWATFLSDPEWIAARADSEKDGPILTHFSNSILQPTSFSSVR
jgi:NIPSNAP